MPGEILQPQPPPWDSSVRRGGKGGVVDVIIGFPTGCMPYFSVRRGDEGAGVAVGLRTSWRYLCVPAGPWPGPGSRFCLAGTRIRSEEHTSELQSLMRISYAVFCLKKK